MTCTQFTDRQCRTEDCCLNNYSIQNKINEIAMKHSQIIEDNIKWVCDKFSIHPDNLIINYLPLLPQL